MKKKTYITTHKTTGDVVAFVQLTATHNHTVMREMLEALNDNRGGFNVTVISCNGVDNEINDVYTINGADVIKAKSLLGVLFDV